MVEQAGLEPASLSAHFQCAVPYKPGGQAGFIVLKKYKWLLRRHLQLGKPRCVPRNSPATVPAFAKRSNPSPNEYNFVCRQPCRNRYDDPPHHKHTSLLSFAICHSLHRRPIHSLRCWAISHARLILAPARSRTGSVASGAYERRSWHNPGAAG